MCQKKSEGGRRCLSHMSGVISPEFKDAYKDLSQALKDYRTDSGPSPTTHESIVAISYVTAKAELEKAHHHADIKDTVESALKATMADAVASRNLRLAKESGTADADQMAALVKGREVARSARSYWQTRVQVALGYPPPAETTPVHETAADATAGSPDPAPSTSSVPLPSTPASAPAGSKVFVAPQITGWNAHGHGPDWKSVGGLPDDTTPVRHVTPGAQFTHDAGGLRHITVKDRRGHGAGPMVIHPQALTEAVNAAGITGPANVEVRLSNKESVYGYARMKKDGTHQVVIAVKDKDQYPAAAGYVMNNSLVHELHHVAQRQVTPNFDAAYTAASQAGGYSGNKFEVAAWQRGRIADHTGTKDQPAGQSPVGGAVWAILPYSSDVSKPAS